MGDRSLTAFIPNEIMAALSGRKFTLVGFEDREANLLAKTLKDTHSLSHSIAPLELGPESETLDACDLVILNLSEKLDGSRWVDGEWMARSQKRLLLVGGRSEIGDHSALNSVAHDILVRPFEPVEMLMRCARLLSRSTDKQRAQAAKEPSRVILADDDANITNLLTALLQNHHMDCSVASNGEAALNGARRLMPDLVVLDVDMPRMNGFEVLAALRKEPGTHALRVLLLTGNQDAADVSKGSELGADDYVIKPFSPAELVARIKKLLNPTSPPAEKPSKVFIR